MTDAERKFKALAEGGSVNMPFGKTFFSKGFGMCVDQFGIPWMVNCPASSKPLRREHRRAARRNCNTHQKIPEEGRHLPRSEDADFARHRYVSDRQRDRAGRWKCRVRVI